MKTYTLKAEVLYDEEGIIHTPDIEARHIDPRDIEKFKKILIDLYPGAIIKVFAKKE